MVNIFMILLMNPLAAFDRFISPINEVKYNGST